MPLTSGSFYERVGGQGWFTALVECFYAGVESDPVLRPLYPADLSGPKQHLAAFLAQRWGGPENYTATRGHPRLRMRHQPFSIGTAEHDAWLRHMDNAVRRAGLDQQAETQLLAFFATAADMLVNRRDG